MKLSRTDAAILGMLTVKPMSGYDLKRFSEQSLAFFWHESYGNLYPRLRRLREAGLVRGDRERRERAPDAIVYSMTTPGRRRFEEWMRTAPEPDRVRSELLLKFFFGAEVEPAVAVRWVREHEEDQRRLLEHHRTTRESLPTPAEAGSVAVYWRLALRRGQLLTEARLRWCHECLAALSEHERGDDERDDP